MKTDPLKQGKLTNNSAGIGTVTRKMVHERAIELAVINGRSAQDVSVTDLQQAKRELAGESDTDPNDVIREAAPESKRWDPVPGSTGHQAEDTSNEDQDDEGRSDSDSERLFEEGVAEAERLAERNIEIDLTKGAKEYIAREAYDPVYGARPLKRFIQRQVETPLSRKLIAGEITDGSHITVEFKAGELVFTSLALKIAA